MRDAKEKEIKEQATPAAPPGRLSPAGIRSVQGCDDAAAKPKDDEQPITVRPAQNPEVEPRKETQPEPTTQPKPPEPPKDWTPGGPEQGG